MLDFDKLPVHRDERGSLFAGMIIAAMVAFVVALVVSLLVINGLQGLKMGDKIADRFIKGHKDKIAVIYIEGPMVADKSTEDGPVACSSDIVRNLRKATDDPGVKAIVLRINSPGGTPVAAEEIISQVNRTKAKKPVVVSMGDMATSAAYFVSCSTDRIIANPDTFTGSIGVIWVFKNKTRYYDDEGINFYIAKSGNFKDVGSDWRGLSESEKTYVQEIINESYERFARSVAKGRNMSLEEVKKIADGRVYTGSKAKELGLVDGLGGLYDAISVASELAHVRGKPDILHMKEPKEKPDQ
jgi:protease-4